MEDIKNETGGIEHTSEVPKASVIEDKEVVLDPREAKSTEIEDLS